MGQLFFGTCSWSASGWRSVFYPSGLDRSLWLSHYATRFGAVEADVTYYRVPSVKMVRGWREKTPPGFRMTAKFPRSIVHGGEGPKPDRERILRWDCVEEDTERFLEAMAELGEGCGPLILQFPYFAQGVFPGPLPFLDRLADYLDRLPGGFRYGVEVRNRDWVDPSLLELLRARDVALVLVDIVSMPHPDQLGAELDLITTNFLYGRLIGDRARVDARTDTFDRIVIDQTERLLRWARLLAEFMPRVEQGFVFANNHYAGHGPATIQQLVERYAEATR